MGKGKGALQKRRTWRDAAFAKMGHRSLGKPTDVRHPNSDVLRRILGIKPLHEHAV